MATLNSMRYESCRLIKNVVRP